MKNIYFSFLLVFMLLILNTTLKAGNETITRENAPTELKWNLTDIYPGWDAWKSDFEKMRQIADKVVGFRGTLNKGAENLLELLILQDELGIISTKLYCYTSLNRSIDTRDQEVSAHFQEITGFFAKLGTATSWIAPEMLSIPEATMRQWLDSNPDFAPYRFGILDAYRQQAHVLDNEKEMLLSYFGLVSYNPVNIYTEISTSDIKYPEITLSTGEKMVMTSGNLNKVLTFNKNQDDRRAAYKAYNGPYRDNLNTYAAIYNGIVQGDWAYAQARKFTNTLEAALDGNNIPQAVYETLIKTTRENTEPLKRYLRLRKKVLNLQEYHAYDGSVSLVDFEKQYPFDEAQNLVLNSIVPLGPDYLKKVQKAISGGWIDVFEGTGKESGAYSQSVYSVHPFILLNYDNTLSYVFTLAHELGHLMHSTLSNETQPYALSGYSSFVAEVASKFNEELLLDYMIKNSKDPKERIVLIDQAINNLFRSFYRQGYLADFELKAHQLAEQGAPVNASSLRAIFADLNVAYFGDNVAPDEEREINFANVHHFYTHKYYVYQYATSYAAAAYLFKTITTGTKAEKQQALNRYINLLKSGGNDFPVNQLKTAGVDMTNPETLKAVVARFDELVTLLEKEINALNK